jgi:hypothetical protein
MLRKEKWVAQNHSDYQENYISVRDKGQQGERHILKLDNSHHHDHNRN